MYQVTIQDTSFTIELNEAAFTCDGVSVAWDTIKLADRSYHVIANNKSYEVEVISLDLKEKRGVMKINGKKVHVSLKNRLDLLLEKMGMGTAVKATTVVLKAPMPGMILEVKVSTGVAVKKGDPLLVLEAMKMENVIKSPVQGQIKNLLIQRGDRVDKNQLLMEFE